MQAWCRASVAAFEAGHFDHRLLVIEESKILRFGLRSLRCYNKQLPIWAFAEGSLESAPSALHHSSPSPFSFLDGVFTPQPIKIRGIPPRRP
jgi:hypothetical protein